MHIIITGAIGIGKSTVVQKALHAYSGQVGGYYTGKIYSGSQVSGLEICSMWGEKKRFAHTRSRMPARFSDWQVDSGLFDTFACDLLQDALTRSDIIVMDELGILEQAAENFIHQVQECFASTRPILAVVQTRALEFWQAKLGVFSPLWQVTHINRNFLPERIRAALTEIR